MTCSWDNPGADPYRGPVEADGRGQTGLVDTGPLRNAFQRGKLHRSQVEARGLRLGLEDLHRLLVQAPYQVPGKLYSIHLCLHWSLDKYSLHKYDMYTYQ